MRGFITMSQGVATSKASSCLVCANSKITPFSMIYSRYLPSWRCVVRMQNCSSSQNISTNSQDLLPSTKWLGDLLLQGHSSSSDMLLRRVALSRAVTLVESTNATKRHQADLLLQYLLHKKQEQAQLNNPFVFRLGIAGPPGAGKSTFIEKLGLHILGTDADGNNTRLEKTTNSGNPATTLCRSISYGEQEVANLDENYPNHLAIVCIDPSSMRSGGSILGDKTRMEQLSRHNRAFVRPSPNRGTLGGIGSYTNDVVALCQLADYPLVIVETVGLGQSEVDVDNTVDMSILLLAPGGGDTLQGVKKGIVEIADMIVINKVDDAKLHSLAKSTAADYRHALQFQRRKVDSWDPPVLLASAVTSQGMMDVWEGICRFQSHMVSNGELYNKRRKQASYWMWKHVEDLIAEKTQNDPKVKDQADAMTHSLESGLIPPRVAAAQILDAVFSSENSTRR